MNYEQIAQFCYDNRPPGVLFASAEEWQEIIERTVKAADKRTVILTFKKLVDANFFHKLNGKNYILNFKYFRKHAVKPRNAGYFRPVHH